MSARLLEDWLSEAQAAAELNKTPRTLQSWRAQGIGPRWTRNGREVLYHRDWLAEYLMASSVQPVRSKSGSR
jgi:hypothetical protein